MFNASHLRITEATRQEVIKLLGIDPVTEFGVELAPPATEDDIVVCSLSSEAHSPDSHIEQCSVCERDIWVAASTSPTPQRRCIDCFNTPD